MTQLNRRRGLIAALLISIAINLFLVGGVAYRFYLMNSEASIGRPLPPNISWLIRDLTPERQEELRAGLRERGMEGRAARSLRVAPADQSIKPLYPVYAQGTQDSLARDPQTPVGHLRSRRRAIYGAAHSG